jgi:hypothetical protein
MFHRPHGVWQKNTLAGNGSFGGKFGPWALLGQESAFFGQVSSCFSNF